MIDHTDLFIALRAQLNARVQAAIKTIRSYPKMPLTDYICTTWEEFDKAMVPYFKDYLDPCSTVK